ncbi:ABC transporter ATP-binding protein [Tundrisphaera lichenicola]|uniref:ABC transporter ATP-binding protein n=1 Tax=Tundrisphaera lichenicola TaxID=2029860 RepID=UPI003EBA946E
MSLSSPTKTSWSSGSDASAVGGKAQTLVELRDVSLRFVTYTDKQYSFKRSALDLLLQRQAPPVSNEFWALRDVNLQMAKGERIGILGFNGAGKSTLLRLLARIYTPTTGHLMVRGTVAPLIEMGAGFNPELSGHDNIMLNGAMLGIKPREMRKKIDGIYEFTGLREFADLPLKYYSSGMYARLAFAIATEVDPEILLIDESLGAGDVIFVDRAKERIKSLLERSNLVVIVSHDLGSLHKMCTRGIWMHEGRVRADAPISEAITQYLLFTQAIDAKAASAAKIEQYANAVPA